MNMPRVSLPVSSTGTVFQTAIELSQLAYGVWRLDADPAGTGPRRVAEKVDACLEQGITTIDHADIYGGYSCEELFGAMLKERPQVRDSLEIVTKAGICLVDPIRPDHRVKHYDTSARHLTESVERSLRNLQTDRVDLLLLHRPDPLMNADETAEALTALHRDGKVLAFGVSNFTPGQTDLLRMRLDLPIVANQIELSPIRLDALTDGTLDHCQQHGIQPMAWSPFGGGELFVGEAGDGVRRVLQSLAVKYTSTVDAVALAWLLKHPTKPIPILGTNRVERIRSAVAGLGLEMARQDWFAIYEAALGCEVA